MSELRFTVPGIAQPKGSARMVPLGGKKGAKRWFVTSDNKKLAPWEHRVALAARAALALGRRGAFPEGPLVLEASFYLPRPKYLLTPTQALLEHPHLVAPDVDKLLRGIADPLKTLVFRDDALLVKVCGHKHYCAAGEQPRAEISVRAVAIIRDPETPRSLFLPPAGVRICGA